MILSANGQNIYPEEIEAILNNEDYVGETLVVERESNRLYALVYFDPDKMKKDGLTADDYPEMEKRLRHDANKRLPNDSQLYKIERRDTPFEKTPKMSIKRYLYK